MGSRLCPPQGAEPRYDPHLRGADTLGDGGLGDVFSFPGSQGDAVPSGADGEWYKSGAPFRWVAIREAALGVAPVWTDDAFPAYFWRTCKFYRQLQWCYDVHSPLQPAFFDLFGVRPDGVERGGRNRTIHLAVAGVDVGVDPTSVGKNERWGLRNGKGVGKDHVYAEKVEKEVLRGRYILFDIKPEGCCYSESNLVPKNELDPEYDGSEARFNRHVVNFSKGGRQGGGLHDLTPKEVFIEWTPFVHIAMLFAMIGALRARVGEEVELAAFILDLREAYRTFSVMKGQRLLTMLRVPTFASGEDAHLPARERKVVLRYILDVACAFGCRASGYACYEAVSAMVWAMENIFAPSVGIVMGLVVATDDFIGVTVKADSGVGRDLLELMLQAGGFGTDGKSHVDVEEALDVPGNRPVWIGYGVDINEVTVWCPPVYLAKVGPMFTDWGSGATEVSVAIADKLQGTGYWLSNFAQELRPFLSSFIEIKSRIDRLGLEDARVKAIVEESRDCARTMVEVVMPLVRERSMKHLLRREQGCEWEMGLITDATRGSDDGRTPSGYGIFFNGYFAKGRFPPAALAKATNAESGIVDNSLLEQLARSIGVLMVRQLWPEGLEPGRVKVSNGNDNSATVGQIRHGRAKWGFANDCLLCLAIASLKSGWDMMEAGDEEAEWLASRHCYFGDPLSRAVGESRKAKAFYQRFLRETRGRPVYEVLLSEDAPFWVMEDPLAVASYTFAGTPTLPLSMFHAWQPQAPGDVIGDNMGQRFLAGARREVSRSGREGGIGSGGEEQRGTRWEGHDRSSSTESRTRRRSGTLSSKHSGGSSLPTVTRNPLLTDTSTKCSGSTRKSWNTTSSASGEAGDGGGDGCGPQGSERPTGRGPHRLRSCGQRGEDADAGNSARERLGQWSWLGSRASGDASILQRADGPPDHFSFPGDVLFSSTSGCGSASGRASECTDVASRSTASTLSLEERGSGCLCSLLATPTFVQSESYLRWQGKAGLPRTGPFSRKKGVSCVEPQ